jgi:acetyl-CoA C-acetyltransferase
MKQASLRRVAIVGSTRIPFCRSGTAYQELSNKDMLSHTLQALVDRFALQGQRLDEVVGGAVITHSRDWNLTRESLLSTDLSADTPGVTMQQACGTSLQAAMMLGAKIATGQIDSAIACGADTTSDAPVVFSRRFAQRLVRLSKARDLISRLGAFKGMSLGELKPMAPSVTEPRTHLSMGQHCELMAREWNIPREAQDQLAVISHHRAAEAYDQGFFDDIVVPCEGRGRDSNVRPDTDLETMAGLRTVFDKSDKGTLTAGNSTTLTDGAAAVLLASEQWAKDRGLPVLAYLTHSRTASVDFVNGEGLLMAPTIAVAEMLANAGLTLQDFDFYEIHEAFAAQVLCTLKAWESETYCRERLGQDQPLGTIDRDKLNVNGSSLAVGHPFAATGARIMGVLAKLLGDKSSGRGLISVCTAGGMGVSAILESA